MLAENAWPLVPNYVARALDLVNLGELDLVEVPEYVHYCKDVEMGQAPCYDDKQRPYYLENFGMPDA